MHMGRHSGFDERTWRAYCLKQHHLRKENKFLNFCARYFFLDFSDSLGYLIKVSADNFQFSFSLCDYFVIYFLPFILFDNYNSYC